MNYHEIEKCSISNGTGFRTVLYVSGCSMRCKGCFNSETWDKDSGKLFDENAKQEVLDSLNHPYIAGITFSGGHPLEPYNLPEVVELMKEIKSTYPTKDIWVYTGYEFSAVQRLSPEVLQYTDVIVDGRFIEDLKDITLKFRGSSNQNIWMKQNGEWVNTTSNQEHYE